MSICVFEILDNYRFRIILEDDHYAGRAWGYYTEEFQLEPNKNGYLFVCINFDRVVEGNFQFNFMTDKPVKSKVQDFNDVFYKSYTEQLVGSWDENLMTTGGCS